MRTKIRKSLVVSAAAVAVVGGVNTATFADSTEPTPIGEGVLQPGPPAEEEAGFTPAPTQDAELPLTPGKPIDGPDAEYCAPKNIYKPSSNLGKHHYGIGVTQANYNATSRTARSWFKSEVGGEVGVTYSGELKVSGKVLVAEVEAKYGVDLSVKITAKIGNEIQIDTPPRKTTYGKFGVWRMKNTGTSYTIYSNCRTSAKSTVTSYTPWHVGWYLWER
ncbi:hypothetical protein [Streptomyces formicae]|uniref:Uncharacterized protein n=1 Tax=Streptomyces formicae TaxID=1616117 RepID=A0ABY3WFA2_9ACTN|nr:hypothetical protein [Streptomyces formicae]UNM10365.1 hypothetical protein J4032_01545 [Streptomyces formicae]